MASLAALCVAATTPDLNAQRAEPTPEALKEVGVIEHRDAELPLDLTFVDEDGKRVKLGDYFQGDRPVMLTLNYYRCPMLCTLQLNGLVEGLAKMDWTPGDEFEIVTVSIDPRETSLLARQKKQGYIKEYGRPAAAPGWHFLTSPQEENVRKLAETVGFNYHYDEETDQYAHAAAVMICTSDGRVSQYLYGVVYDPQTLRLSLLEAGRGEIGSVLDQILLFCYHYDAEKGRYAPAAMNLMRAGGTLTVVILAVAVISLRRRGTRQMRNGQQEAQP